MTQLRVIDVAALSGGGSAQQSAIEALHTGLREIGFVALAGHGIGDALLEPAYAALRQLFARSPAEKLRYTVKDGAGARGYTGYRIETAKDAQEPDLKEFWHVGRELHTLRGDRGYPDNVWPHEVPSFRPAMLALYQALDQLANRLLEAIALGLGLSAQWFDDAVREGNSILRALHYPPLPGGDVSGVRSAAHEDINLITLLVTSEEPGLEIKTRSGAFIPIATSSSHVVLNVGDMLSRLTNDVLPSTTHRVVNPPAPWSLRSRYSLPFFVHPVSDFLLATLPSCVSAERPNRYLQPITAGAFLAQRLVEIGLVTPRPLQG